MRVKLPDGSDLKASKIGNISLRFYHDFGHSDIILNNVYFVEGIKRNLLSFSKIAKKCEIISKGNQTKIYEKGKLMAEAFEVNGLYLMKGFFFDNSKGEIYANSVELTEKEKWHRALGDINFEYLGKLVKDKLLNGLPEKLESCKMKCPNCIQSKMTNQFFDNDRTETSETLELVHTDLNGPHTTLGYGGEKYFLTFIDDYSKCTKTFCIKSKSETIKCFVEYTNQVENRLNKKIKQLHCDNGKEHLNQQTYDFIRKKGIESLPCPPYVHELNGVAERYNRSAMDMGRCLMREANIDKRYWPEAIKTMSYLKNRGIANTIENKTPFEIFFGRKPSVKHLKIYESRVLVRIPVVLRKSKWDDKAKVGVLVGYNNNSYRVLVKGEIINARHVTVIEGKTWLICLEQILDDFDDFGNSEVIDDLENENIDRINENANNTGKHLYNENEDDSENDLKTIETIRNNSDKNTELIVEQRTSNRKRSPIQRYGNPISHFIYVHYVNANVPNTFEKALDSNDCENWRKAMDTEIECLNKNKTWTVMSEPKDVKIIDVKWIYKKKGDNTFKARLVVRGFQ